MFYFIFFFSEHRAVTNDVELIVSNQNNSTANNIARKYIYTSQTNYKVQPTAEPVLSSFFVCPLSDTRHQKIANTAINNPLYNWYMSTSYKTNFFLRVNCM